MGGEVGADLNGDFIGDEAGDDAGGEVFGASGEDLIPSNVVLVATTSDDGISALWGGAGAERDLVDVLDLDPFSVLLLAPMAGGVDAGEGLVSESDPTDGGRGADRLLVDFLCCFFSGEPGVLD